MCWICEQQAGFNTLHTETQKNPILGILVKKQTKNKKTEKPKSVAENERFHNLHL